MNIFLSKALNTIGDVSTTTQNLYLDLICYTKKTEKVNVKSFLSLFYLFLCPYNFSVPVSVSQCFQLNEE